MVSVAVVAGVVACVLVSVAPRFSGPQAAETLKPEKQARTRPVAIVVPELEDPLAPKPAKRKDESPVAAKPAEEPLNYALATSGATASGGVTPQLLIDGNDSEYDGGNGYAHTDWTVSPAQAMVVTLKNAVKLDCICFLLWDREEARFYRYKIEVCADEAGKDWQMLADRSAASEACKSWQVIRFDPKLVRQIRLTGTFNSVNSGFHVVELEAYFGKPTKPVVFGAGLEF